MKPAAGCVPIRSMWRRRCAPILLAASLCVSATVAPAGTAWYVVPGGGGAMDGSSWSQAFDDIHAAVAVATAATDVVYLQAGTYVLSTPLDVSGRPGLTLAGGYAADTNAVAPGPLAASNSVVSQVGGMRLLQGESATVTVSRVTFTDGLLGAARLGGGLMFSNSWLALHDVTVEGCQLGHNSLGGGIYAWSCETLLSNCTVRANRIFKQSDMGQGRGGGMAVQGGTLTVLDSVFDANRLEADRGNHTFFHGTALYAQDATVTVRRTTLADNLLYASSVTGENGYGWGGGALLERGRAFFDACVFSNNMARSGGRGGSWGGALAARDVTRLDIVDSDFGGNVCHAYVGRDNFTSVPYGGAVYIEGADTQARIERCRFLRNAVAPDLYGGDYAGDIELASGQLSLAHTRIEQAQWTGLHITGGEAIITNCLVAASGADGVLVDDGTATLFQASLADNGGWGLSETGAAVAVTNSLAWGNASGGLRLQAGTVGYTHAQETHAGVQNQVSDPRWVYGYYLSATGLPGQVATSAAVDAGLGSAAAFGLGGRTTRTDGVADAGAVDLGWHAEGGMSLAMQSNLVLYVDVVQGDDANDGYAAGAGHALQTVTEALARVLPGGTVHVATGTYSTASGEVFPLDLGVPNLTLAGSGAADTVLYGDDLNRVAALFCAARATVRDLTFRNGRRGNLEFGAGMVVSGTRLSMAHCVLRQNRIVKQSDYGSCFGAGMFAEGSDVALEGVTFHSNRIYRVSWNNEQFYGAGLYTRDVTLTASGVVFDANSALTGGLNNTIAIGGGAYLVRGRATLRACVFSNNLAGARYRAGGAALVAEDVAPLRVDDGRFGGNEAWHSTANANYATLGGTMLLFGDGLVAALTRCAIVANGGSTRYGDIHIEDGAATLTNCLVAANRGDAVRAVTAAVDIVNCTIATNEGWGVRINGATVDLLNSIVWGNTTGSVQGAVGSVRYSNLSSPMAGDGNLSEDPLFVDAPGRDFHLRSVEGAWHAGSTTFVSHAQHSPCIDAGDPDVPAPGTLTEPHFNGRRVNMGAYGNTAFASLSIYYPGTVLLFR